MTKDDMYFGYHGLFDHHDYQGKGILRDDIIIQADTLPTQRSLTPYKSDVTVTVCRDQESNSGEWTKIVTRCV
jgi:hypothetical protein